MNKPVEKEITIDFRFAKYMSEFYEQLGQKSISTVWIGMAQSLCNHEWEKTENEEDYYAVCKNCGIDKAFAWYEDPIHYRCGCHNCMYSETDGGDYVPYGSTYVRTPECQVCVAEETENMSDEDIMKLMEDPKCPYWKGSTPRKPRYNL